MKKLLLILAIVIPLSACGSGEVLVSLDTLTWDEMQVHCPNEPTGCYGYYYLDTLPQPNTCQIYVLPKELYFTDEQYHQTLGHELRHCLGEENF